MPVIDAKLHRPLDPEACRILADSLGDTPHTVIAVHFLRQGTCRAYVAGAPARFDGAIVQGELSPGQPDPEPTGFGSDPQTLWELLQGVEGWDCILVDSEAAPLLGKIVRQEMDLPVRYLDDVCFTLEQPVKRFHDPPVRQLTLDDLALLESAPLELRKSCWDSTQSLLTRGIIACAIVSGRIVATALVSARTTRHAEIGVYTQPDYRRRGYATAAASLVARRAQEAGQTPVWSAGAHNQPSLRIARKLGFVEVSRKRYVILDRQRE
jgi:RimJ/RimL family protein N-acetyltransferase